MHSEQLRQVLSKRIETSEPYSIRDSIFRKELYSIIQASEKWDEILRETGVDVLEAEKYRVVGDNGKTTVLPVRQGVNHYLDEEILNTEGIKKDLLESMKKEVGYFLTMDILFLEEKIPFWPCLYGSSIMVNDVVRHIQNSRFGRFHDIGQVAYDYCQKYNLGGDNWKLFADAVEQFISNSARDSGSRGCRKFKRALALMR